MNCETYNGENNCVECAIGYDLIAPLKCDPLLDNTGCLRSKNGICHLCIPSRILVNGVCLFPLEYKRM